MSPQVVCFSSSVLRQISSTIRFLVLSYSAIKRSQNNSPISSSVLRAVYRTRENEKMLTAKQKQTKKRLASQCRLMTTFGAVTPITVLAHHTIAIAMPTTSARLPLSIWPEHDEESQARRPQEQPCIRIFVSGGDQQVCHPWNERARQ